MPCRLANNKPSWTSYDRFETWGQSRPFLAGADAGPQSGSAPPQGRLSVGLLEFGHFRAAAPHGWGMLQLAIRAKLGQGRLSVGLRYPAGEGFAEGDGVHTVR